MYSVELIEAAETHPSNFVVNRLPYAIRTEHQDKRYVIIILCFATPFEIMTRNGLEKGEPGDCFIGSPVFPEFHRSCEGSGFVNDWMHVRVHSPKELEKMGVPMNTIIHTRDAMFIRSHVESIKSELLHRDKLYEYSISNSVEKMLIDLTRVYGQKEESESKKPAYVTQLIQLREFVAARLGTSWTVSGMAEKLNLSASRFSTLYRRQFNTSPLEDLIQMRVTAAKKLLVTTDMGIKDIASGCGFQSEFYFCRVFKSRVGATPTTYRQK